MSESYEPDRPWTEAQWLAEFRRNDVRSARFGELLETLADDPDCDKLIAREMGWGRDDEDDGEPEDEFVEQLSFMDDVMESQLRKVNEALPCDSDEPTDLLHDEDADDRREGLPLLSEVPAYQKAVELAHFVIDLNNEQGDVKFADLHHEELFTELFGNSLIPAAKMRGGHSFGYDDQICANIVCNRFALEAAEKAERALVELHSVGTLPAEYHEEVLPRLRELIALLNERIAEMRRRVWW